MQEKHWIFIALFEQKLSRVLHQQGMSIMNRVSQLECKYRISLDDHIESKSKLICF